MGFYPKYSENLNVLDVQTVMNSLFQDWKTKNSDYSMILADSRSIVINVHNIFRQYVWVKAYIFLLDERTVIDFKVSNWSIIFPLIPLIMWIYITNGDILGVLGFWFSMFLLSVMFYLLQLLQYRQSRNKFIKEINKLVNNEILTSKV